MFLDCATVGTVSILHFRRILLFNYLISLEVIWFLHQKSTLYPHTYVHIFTSFDPSMSNDLRNRLCSYVSVYGSFFIIYALLYFLYHFCRQPFLVHDEAFSAFWPIMTISIGFGLSWFPFLDIFLLAYFCHTLSLLSWLFSICIVCFSLVLFSWVLVGFPTLFLHIFHFTVGTVGHF